MIASCTTSASDDAFDLQPDRPDEIEHFDHDGVRHLGFLDDVAQDRLGVFGLGQLALQDPRHHLDAGQRVLDLVGDRRRHFAERREAVAQPFAFFELLDARQVLEEERGASQAAAGVDHLRQRVADHLACRFQTELGTVGEVRQLEGPGQDPRHVRHVAEDFGKRPADIRRPRRQAENPIRDLVHDRDIAVARDREDAVPEIPDEVAVEAVGDGTAVRSRLPDRDRSLRGGSRGDGGRPSRGGSGFSHRHGIGRRKRIARLRGGRGCKCPFSVSQGLFHL